MTPIEITQQYFKASNKSSFEELKKMFTSTSTYSSQNTGLYLGGDDIISMQKVFHGSFQRLEWQVQDMKEEKPGIVRVEFNFAGVKDGAAIAFSGIEYVVVLEDKIQHIEIKNK